MRCRYVYDKEAGKVWIPGCWGGLYGPDGCHCSNEPTTFAGFEKQKYNETVSSLKAQLNEVQKENSMLWRLFRKRLQQKDWPLITETGLK
jgi:hypothetical protein